MPNWFTVLAQVINFLILVWLLKHFLYKPILHAIDEREKGIAAQLAQAEAKKAEAQQVRDDLEHKNKVFDQERAALLRKATDDAQGERRRLLDDARNDAASLRAKRQEALRNEQRNLSQEIIRWTQREVFAITRKILADLADTSLEARLVEVFVHRLRALAGETREQLAAALKTSTQPASVRSAFDLPPEQQATIQKALNETFSSDLRIQFQTVPELVSGIEFSTNGQKVAWSIADYLTSLEMSAGELLHEDARASRQETKSGTEAGASTGPNPEPQHGLELVAAAPKVDH